ncbi:hypothetical protein SVIOM342S_03261 [Streptomyces violaceorubidus]
MCSTDPPLHRDGPGAGDVVHGGEPYPGSMSSTPDPEPRAPRPALVFDDPLDRQSSDDTDRGWGERPEADSTADLKRFLDEKPPHHL